MRVLLLGLVLAVAVGSGLGTASPAGAQGAPTAFADVEPGRFYADPVEWAHERGIVRGVVPACFLPDRYATRAEVATVLQRLLAPDTTAITHPFVDVDAAWQQVPVAWMADNDLTTGVSPTEFAPDRVATRAMIGTFLWRIEGRPAVDGITHPFVDVAASWQREPVEWLWREGFTTGRSATRFVPDAPVTRGELMTFIWRWQGEPPAPTDLVAPEPIDCLVATGTCADVFPAAVVAAFDAEAGGRRVTAHVHDHRTGCTYALQPGLEITTASVIKAQVLAGVLLNAQDRGEPVSVADAERIRRMLHYSHNSPPTSELYGAVGGAAGMEALDQRFGLGATSHTARYGATLSTAADRTRLVEQLLIGGGPLDANRVAEAWAWMRGVSSAQSWGVSAGLPADHDVALKNGFFPMAGRGWRIGSTGVVRTPDGGAYAMTVMSDGNPTEAAGIALVESVAARVNGALTLGAPAPRRVDGSHCVTSSGRDSWASMAAALGVTDVEQLRFVNGGEPAVLSGQRVCAP